MPITNVEEMIIRQLDNKLTGNELDELAKWYNSSAENQKLYRDYCALLKAQAIASDKALFEKDRIRSWNRLKKRIQKDRGTHHLWTPVWKYASVAVVALLIGLGGGAYFTQDVESEQETIVEVPMGAKSKVILPDGTAVWLNSDTKLVYTKDFGRKNRTVYLDGEGFFDVTKNKKLPFEVYAGETHIRVLGTRFDMKAYSDDVRKRVTLLSGSLSIAMKGDAGSAKIISPDEQAIIVKGNPAIEVRPVEAKNYILWTETKKEAIGSVKSHNANPQLPQMRSPSQTFRNTLLFDEEPLTQIVRDLSRAFNVVIELGSEDIGSEIYYGDFRNEEDIYEILNVITSSGKIDYKVKENKIIIKKKVMPMGNK